MTQQEVIEIYAADGNDVNDPAIREELIEKSHMVLSAIDMVGTTEESEAARTWINNVLEVLNNWSE